MNNDIISEFRQCLSQEAILTQPEDLITYSYDGTPMLREMPKAVVFPTSTEEVATILRLASKNGTPVVTRGAGTGLSGGSIPVPEGIVLCLARMNRVLELDTENLTILVEPGVINNDVAMKADSAGLFYPPDPGSMKVSTIGGNVSENSGGGCVV